MKISAVGEKLIKQFETCVLFCYDDAVYPSKPFKGGTPKGELTIGWGHTKYAGDPVPVAGMKISRIEADAILRRDLLRFESRVKSLVKVELTQSQFDALVSFDFNTGGLGRSTLLKKLNAGNYDAVPGELMKWVNDNGKALPGLVKRRRAECALWRGIDESEPPVRANVRPETPQPSKSIVQSKEANAALLTGALSGVQVSNDVMRAAAETHSNASMIADLLTSPGFLAMLVIALAAAGIWFWRYRRLQEEGA